MPPIRFIEQRRGPIADAIASAVPYVRDRHNTVRTGRPWTPIAGRQIESGKIGLEQIKNVTETAFVMAEFRAEENNATDPLYRDPVIHEGQSEARVCGNNIVSLGARRERRRVRRAAGQRHRGSL